MLRWTIKPGFRKQEAAFVSEGRFVDSDLKPKS